MISAKIIADSKNTQGQRITSAIITFPRYLLAEFNTHRAATRNSASSRAIRLNKMIQSVKDNTFMPSRWQKDHPGMQGTEYFDLNQPVSEAFIELDRSWSYSSNSDITVGDVFKKEWLMARDNAIDSAESLHRLGVTKQICNRLLEPFMYHTALVTGTEWENFFALRAHKDAEIHFQDLAEQMLVAFNESTPKQLEPGDWHMPFGDQFDKEKLIGLAHTQLTRFKPDFAPSVHDLEPVIQELQLKLATVRCAQISYLTHENEKSYVEMLELHDRLASSGHWSAFEHCGKAMSLEEYQSWGKFEGWDHKYYENHNLGWCGNFHGFIQYRKMFPNENRTDSRLIQK
jgi:thymidylate synthase ThyX